MRSLHFGIVHPSCCWVPIAIRLPLMFGPWDASLQKWPPASLCLRGGLILTSCSRSFSDVVLQRQSRGLLWAGCRIIIPSFPSGGSMTLPTSYRWKRSDHEMRPLFWRTYFNMTPTIESYASGPSIIRIFMNEWVPRDHSGQIRVGERVEETAWKDITR